MAEPIETGEALVEALSDGHNNGTLNLADPVYATTPNGTYLFVITDVASLFSPAGEQRTVLRLREVAQE